MNVAPMRAALGIGALLALTASAAAQAPHLDTRGDRHPQVRRAADGSLVFRNRHLVAVVEKTGTGFGVTRLYPATRPTEPASSLVAEIPALNRLTWREGEATHSGTFTPTEAAVSESSVRFRGTVKEGSVEWRAETELSIGDAPWLSWTARVRPSAAAGLLRMAPVPLRVGHAGPREAIFPGLDFIEGLEVSSSIRGNRAGEHLRLVPEPHELTIPLISLSQDETTVALLWDQHQDWGGPGYPSALFDSPNRAEGGTNHRMELFLPSVPQFVKEDEEVASTPLPVAAGQELRLSGKIAVFPEENSPVRAIREWVRAYGRPEPAPRPRSLDAERKLIRQALAGPIWQPGEGGWRHALWNEPYPVHASPVNTMALLVESWLSGGATGRQLAEQSQTVIAGLRKAGHLEPQLAYRLGGVIEALEDERAQVVPLIRSQLANGSWPWDPRTDEHHALGDPGHTEIGIVASRAVPLLHHAALTGDSEAAGAGIRALEFMSRNFRVPRGGQSWELPLSTPDILAAASAAEAFLLGYQVSGEERYLETARYWADAGLPFVYFWSEPGKPAMKFATLPGFGASFHDQSWFGQPVQWSGLTYARVLRDLHRIRPDALYDAVAEGILSSAMHQQYATGADAGLYPYFWDLFKNQGGGPKLNPELIAAHVYRSLGYDLEVARTRVRVGPDRLMVASGAEIEEARTSAMRLWLELQWVDEQETYTTITGVLAKPVAVQYNTSRLRQRGIPVSRNFLPEGDIESQPGWRYYPDLAMLVLRLPHTGGRDRLEIRWPDPKDRSPVERIDTRRRYERQTYP